MRTHQDIKSTQGHEDSHYIQGPLKSKSCVVQGQNTLKDIGHFRTGPSSESRTRIAQGKEAERRIKGEREEWEGKV